MEKRRKFILSLPVKQAKKIRSIIRKIVNHDLDGLDIKPISDKKGRYRYRVGTIRILFSVNDAKIIIQAAGFRGSIYKDL